MDSRLLQALHTSLRLLLSTSLRLLYYVQEFYKYSAVLYKYNICIYAREEISTQVLRFIVCDLSSKRLRNAVSYITQATGMLSPILLKPPRDTVCDLFIQVPAGAVSDIIWTSYSSLFSWIKPTSLLLQNMLYKP